MKIKLKTDNGVVGLEAGRIVEAIELDPNSSNARWIIAAPGTYCGVLHIHSDNAEEVPEDLHAIIDSLIQHCPDPECAVCAEAVCRYKDPLHFHHDGCPSCHAP
jgi:hypothetical protein